LNYEYEFTKDKTHHVLMQCKYCNEARIIPANTSDGRRCPNCNGGLYIPIGYVKEVRNED
jgi:ribosomal protein S27E